MGPRSPLAILPLMKRVGFFFFLTACIVNRKRLLSYRRKSIFVLTKSIILEKNFRARTTNQHHNGPTRSSRKSRPLCYRLSRAEECLNRTLNSEWPRTSFTRVNCWKMSLTYASGSTRGSIDKSSTLSNSKPGNRCFAKPPAHQKTNNQKESPQGVASNRCRDRPGTAAAPKNRLPFAADGLNAPPAAIWAHSCKI